MKSLLQSFSVLMLLALISTPTFAQRYLNEIFTGVDSAANVQYGINLSVLTGTPKPDTMKMDIYHPQGDNFAKRPLIILCHTGSFLPPVYNGQATGRRQDSTIVEMAKQFARRGYVCAIMSNRLGWNATSADQDVRTGTLLGAAYRGIQDLRTCARYFRRSVAENNNPYGIDSSFIVAGGVGTGGYITFGAATLDKTSELQLTKFINGQTGAPYVDPAIFGNFDGTDTAPLCMPNHVGYSSKLKMVFNLGGALADSTWLEAGDIPMVGFHCTKDPYAPYNYGAVIVPTTGDFVVNVSGTYDVVARANRLGNNAAMHASVATLNDPYTLRANSVNNGNEGMFPIITPAPGAPLSCTGAGANAQIEQGSPWDWWNEAWYTAAATAIGQPGAVVNCLQKRGNPDMSATKGRTYLDSVMQYLNPRIVGTLGLTSTAIEDGMNKDVKVYPNPAQDMVMVRSNSNQIILGVEVMDITGRQMAKVESLFTTEFALRRNGLPTGMYLLKVKFQDGKEGLGKIWFE